MRRLISDEIGVSDEIKDFGVNNFFPRRRTTLGKSLKNAVSPDFFENIQPQSTKLAHNATVWRAGLLILVVLIGGLLFIARAINLQLMSSSYFKSLAAANRTRKSVILAERGVIYSSDKQVLARNRPAFALELNTSLCGSMCHRIVSGLASYIDIDADGVAQQILSGKTNILLSTDLDREKVLFIETKLQQLPGLSILVYPIRNFLYPEVFAHCLGYVGLDDVSLQPKVVGKTGVEKSYDAFLSGISGQSLSEVDSTGKKYTIVSQEDSLPGKDLQVYLNLELSKKAYELLKKVVDEKKAKAGVVVAQDPGTGGVLALVSYPSFDANKMSEGISFLEYKKLMDDPAHPFFNRAISAVYPPGSTFKMITASAALSENVVTRYTTIFDKGFIEVGGSRFNNWNLAGHGEVDMVRAIQVSNDTYFYTIGGGYGGVRGLGIEKLSSWAKKFGVGSLTGIDIDGEVPGNMPDGKSRAWYLGDTYITSIGQGDVLTTPLQMNTVTSYFANGGFLIKPRIVKSISGVEEYDVEVVAQNLINKKNYDIIREGLKKAVQPGGTGYPVYDFPQKHNGIELGGKTGTSEFIDSNGKPATHALFTVFGPFDRATIALTVFLEGGGAGSDDAAPIARELLDVWFK